MIAEKIQNLSNVRSDVLLSRILTPAMTSVKSAHGKRSDGVPVDLHVFTFFASWGSIHSIEAINLNVTPKSLPVEVNNIIRTLSHIVLCPAKEKEKLATIDLKCRSLVEVLLQHSFKLLFAC